MYPRPASLVPNRSRSTGSLGLGCRIAVWLRRGTVLLRVVFSNYWVQVACLTASVASYLLWASSKADLVASASLMLPGLGARIRTWRDRRAFERLIGVSSQGLPLWKMNVNGTSVFVLGDSLRTTTLLGRIAKKADEGKCRCAFDEFSLDAAFEARDFRQTVNAYREGFHHGLEDHAIWNASSTMAVAHSLLQYQLLTRAQSAALLEQNRDMVSGLMTSVLESEPGQALWIDLAEQAEVEAVPWLRLFQKLDGSLKHKSIEDALGIYNRQARWNNDELAQWYYLLVALSTTAWQSLHQQKRVSSSIRDKVAHIVAMDSAILRQSKTSHDNPYKLLLLLQTWFQSSKIWNVDIPLRAQGYAQRIKAITRRGGKESPKLPLIVRITNQYAEAVVVRLIQ